MRRALGIGVLVVLAALGAFLTYAPPARAANVYIDIHGSLAGGWGFTPGSETNPGPTITTAPTDSVHLNLTSDDGAPHTFLLDYNHNNVSDPAEPLSPTFTTTTVTLTINSAPPGQYWYICTIHGWNAMRGRWIVLGSSANDTTAPAISAAAVNPTAPHVNDTVTISASVTDTGGSGVANVTAHITGPSSFDQNLTMTLGSGSTYSVSHVFATAGNYSVAIWARDAAGNNATASLTFTVSTTSGGGGTPPPAAQDNTALYAGIAVVVIVVLLIAGLAMSRRGKKTSPPKEESPPTPPAP